MVIDKKTEELFIKLLIDEYKMEAFYDKMSKIGFEPDIDLIYNTNLICDYLDIQDEEVKDTIQFWKWNEFTDKLKLKGFTFDKMMEASVSQSVGGMKCDEKNKFYKSLNIEMKSFVDVFVEYKIIGLN